SAPNGAPSGLAIPPATAPGTTNLSSLVNPSLGSFGELMQPWTQQFQAPTNITEQNDPGYQARLALAQQAMEHSAAARGDILSGGTLQQENQMAQDYASNEYNNVYNRALQQYQQNYNIFQNNQANQYNRLAGLSGVGQQTAAQLNSAGLQNAATMGSLALGASGQIGQDIQNAAAAQASGYVGAANAIGGALGGLGGDPLNLYMLSKLLNQGN
ncbi:MAG: hypothetical protein JO041_11425, partial [Acidobacteria bacterium]|nr:hypothetical protein [Acidobacteriota bacterium]